MAVVLLAGKYGRVDIGEVKASFRMHRDQKGFLANITEWCEDSLDLINLMRELAPDNKDEVFREGLRFFSKSQLSSTANNEQFTFSAFHRHL